LVVDDGSTDATPRIVAEYAARDPRVRLQRHERNMGPGSGFVTGVPLAEKELVIFLPADLAMRLDQLALYLDAIRGSDIVVGVSTARPDYSLLRKIQSRVYILLIKLLFGLKQRQFNYIHMYRRDALLACAPKVPGVFMSVEILVRARDAGLRISEVDIEYVPREHGAASCGKPSVILDTIRDALKFRMSWHGQRKKV